MNLCNDGHDEICYEGRICPACSVLEEVATLKDRIETLEQRLEQEQS